MSVDEPRYLAVAWEMWQRADWLVPRLNGMVYPDKPPLLFWCINLAWSLFGVSETAARTVPIVFALLSLALTTVLARRFWPADGQTAGGAALILAGAGLFAVMSTLVMFDALLTVCVMLGVIGLDSARRGRSLSGWCLFGLGIGLGVLAKGPVVLVHLLPPALLAPLWLRGAPAPAWSRWYLGCAAGVAIGALIALAWAIPAAVHGGAEYRDAIFWGQSASRIVGSSEHSHARPIWFYLAVLPALLFPWIVWPPLWSVARRLRVAADDPMRMLAVWGGCAFVILSAIGGKQSHYLMPELPALALAAARALAVAPEGRRGPGWTPALVLAVLGAAGIGMTVWAGTGHPLPRVLTGWPLWFGPAFLALAVALALARRAFTALPIMAALCPAILLLGQLAARDALDVYGVGDASRTAAPHEAAGIAFVGDYHGELTFQGRLGKPVASLPDLAAMKDWVKAHPGGVLVGEPDADTQALGLPEILRRPYRSKAMVIWQVPG